MVVERRLRSYGPLLPWPLGERPRDQQQPRPQGTDKQTRDLRHRGSNNQGAIIQSRSPHVEPLEVQPTTARVSPQRQRATTGIGCFHLLACGGLDCAGYLPMARPWPFLIMGVPTYAEAWHARGGSDERSRGRPTPETHAQAPEANQSAKT